MIVNGAISQSIELSLSGLGRFDLKRGRLTFRQKPTDDWSGSLIGVLIYLSLSTVQNHYDPLDEWFGSSKMGVHFQLKKTWPTN